MAGLGRSGDRVVGKWGGVGDRVRLGVGRVTGD